MVYNVAQLLKEAVGATREYNLVEIVLGVREGWGSLHVEGLVNMLRTPSGILVTGALMTGVQEECSRCLEPFSQYLDLSIEEEFFPVADVSTGATVEVPERAGSFLINEKHILDLMEAFRQAVLLDKPLQPLCRADCDGMCTECGTPLKEAQCDCSKQPLDSRWAPLAHMLGDTT